MLNRRVRTILAIVLMPFLSTERLIADNGPNHQTTQTSPIQLGTSGGNKLDKSRAFCCSGTLGSLVKDSFNNLYILSNNHVLARTDVGTVGEDILQPGLIDVGCRATSAQQVADLADFVPLANPNTNVDAAIAQIISGRVDSTGAILDIGVPASTPKEASVGLGVAKSGRTTGLTCAAIGSINTTVNVQYQKGCGSGKKFTKTFTNQVVINSNSFSAGGDSGSLIVTSDKAEPLALLFAGSSSTTIGNPVADVTLSLGVSFVGGDPHSVSCPTTASSTTTTSPEGKPKAGRLSSAEVEHATAVKELNEAHLMADPAVMGVGIGGSEEDPSVAVIVIYLEQGRAHGPIPSKLDGVRTQIIRTDRIRAFGWSEPEQRVCQAK